MVTSPVQSAEKAAAYAERVGVHALLEELALQLLRDRPEDPRRYLASLLGSSEVNGMAATTGYLQQHFPRNFAAITTEWLSNLVNCKVESFESTMLEDGAMSDAVIIRPTYKKGTKVGPASFVLKYAKGSEQGRAVATAARMYLKELNFYDELRDDVHKFLSCPRIMNQFRDPQAPDTYFCIAMEDLSVEYEPMNGAEGISFDEAMVMLRNVARMHAHFWDSSVLKKPWLDLKDKDGCTAPVWFDAWYQLLVDWEAGPKDLSTKWFNALRETTGVNVKTPELVELVELMEDHAAPMRNAIYAQLLSRPKTLVHGDLRCDNLFRDTKGNMSFVAIDWQAVTASNPAIEFCQLLMISLEPEHRFEDIDTIYETYLSALYQNCPPARETYTKAMLNEDCAVGCILWMMALTPMLYTICASNPDAPLWKILEGTFRRMKKFLSVTKAPTICQALAKRAGII